MQQFSGEKQRPSSMGMKRTVQFLQSRAGYRSAVEGLELAVERRHDPMSQGGLEEIRPVEGAAQERLHLRNARRVRGDVGTAQEQVDFRPYGSAKHWFGCCAGRHDAPPRLHASDRSSGVLDVPHVLLHLHKTFLMQLIQKSSDSR
jgi:hypothetical protein